MHEALRVLFAELMTAGVLMIDEPMKAARRFNWLVMAEPVNRAMLLGLAEPPSRSQIEEWATDVAPSPPDGIAATPHQDESDASIDLSAYTGPHHDRAMTLNGALPADAFVWPRDQLLRRLPIGSVNGCTNAQGLARLYRWALGTFPAATLTDLTTPHTSGPDLVPSAPAMTIEQRFSRGFEVITADADHGRVRAFGHHGLGGITAFADPVRRVAFAYTAATARFGPPGADPRAARLIRAVYSCLTGNTPPR